MRTIGTAHVIEGREVYVGDTLIADVLDTSEGLEGTDGEADANAAFIALAWNRHDGLIDGIRHALDCLEEINPDSDDPQLNSLRHHLLGTITDEDGKPMTTLVD